MAYLARLGRASCYSRVNLSLTRVLSPSIYFSKYSTSSSKPATEPPQPTPEMLQKRFTEEGAKLKSCLEKEIKNLSQVKQDQDLVDDFLKLYQFKISPTNSNILTKTVGDEEIIIDIEPTHSDNLLCQELPDIGTFEVLIKKNNTTVTFICQYDCNSNGETYTLKEMRAREKDDKGTGLKTSNLEDATTAIFANFLYSRVPPTTPQVIDTFLNMRGDKEYLQFLSTASKLFETPTKPS